jgi:hypothetical protein
MSKPLRILLISFILLALSACGKNEAPISEGKKDTNFDAVSLRVKESEGVKRVRGQVLYVPIYSNIPCESDRLYDLSAFIAIHNTDLYHSITVTKVLYFDNDGKMVKDFAYRELSLSPMAATNFHIPKKDKSGTGANFLVEWMSETPVSEPLIESIMVDCQTNRGLSFLSKGKVIREVK